MCWRFTLTEFGYAGKILKVNLSDGNVTRVPSANYTDKFLGGQGIAARLYWEMVPAEAGAFDPENCLICASGPVMGFPRFAGFRWKACGKTILVEPESYNHANLGERWGAFLKYAGYDALAVQGKAEKPAYIIIDNDRVEIRDASNLWGMSTFDAIDSLKAEFGKDSSVLTIGPAAENLVSFATMLTDEGASGSGGLGVVMGSKKLKAIVVVASSWRPVAAHPDKLKQLADRVREMKPSAGIPDMWAVPGLTRNHVCYGCGIGCTRQMYTAEKGRRYKSFCQAMGFYGGPVMRYYGEYHEAQLLGTRLCDGYGLDTAVMMGMIEWLYTCYQEGLITEEQTGLPLAKTGSREFIEALTRKIAYREGFGDILSRGTLKAAESIGEKAREFTSRFVATRGSETRDYDPRLMITTGIFYATEPRRPIQQLHDVSMLIIAWLHMVMGEENAFFTNDDLREVAAKFWGGEIAADFSTIEGKGLAAKKIQDRIYVKESLVLCDIFWPIDWAYYSGGHTGDPTLESQIYSAITGKEIDEAGLNKIGERIFNLQRAILLRQGWQGRKDDRMLDYFHEVPLQQGELFFDPDGLILGKDDEIISKIGKVVDREQFERLKDDYYQQRGWDVASGLPTRARLEELQLEDVATYLEGRGLLK
jgi:aldehyde:ferredoxin oxidoreductase